MALADVKRTIEEKNKNEVEAVLQSARAEAERIIGDAKEQVSKASEAHHEQTKVLLANMERREQAAAAFARKTTILEEKRKAIDAVFEKAKQRLASANSSERASLLNLIIERANTAANGSTISALRAHSSDVAALKKAFPNAIVTADDSILGGFLADDSSGTIRLDYTYETILEAVAEACLESLTERLFSRR